MISSDDNRLYKRVGWIFITVGIIFCTVGGAGYAGQLFVRKSMCPAEAVVTARYPGGTEVEYSANGQIYRSVLNYSSDFLREGDTLTVYYQADHPEETAFGEPVIFLVFIITGLVVLLTGVFAGRRYAGMQQKHQYLMKNGQKLYAEIIRVDSDYRYQRSYAYAKKIICQYHSPDGKIHIFESEPIWLDLPSGLIGKKAAVYVERGNDANYFVDLSFITSDVEIHIH